MKKNPFVLAFQREYGNEKLLVVCNFYGSEICWNSGFNLEGYKCLIGNYLNQQLLKDKIKLRPYETLVLYNN